MQFFSQYYFLFKALSLFIKEYFIGVLEIKYIMTQIIHRKFKTLLRPFVSKSFIKFLMYRLGMLSNLINALEIKTTRIFSNSV
jgi:hypothetical protein